MGTVGVGYIHLASLRLIKYSNVTVLSVAEGKESEMKKMKNSRRYSTKTRVKRKKNLP